MSKNTAHKTLLHVPSILAISYLLISKHNKRGQNQPAIQLALYEIGETIIAKLGSLAQQILLYLNCTK